MNITSHRPQHTVYPGKSKKVELEYERPVTRVVHDAFAGPETPVLKSDDAIRAYLHCRSKYQPTKSAVLDENNKPKMESVKETLRISGPSKTAAGEVALTSFMSTLMIGLPLGIAFSQGGSLLGLPLGLAVGAATGFAAAYKDYSKDRKDSPVSQLTWKQTDIVERELDRSSPPISFKETVHGTYWKPEVVTLRQSQLPHR